MTQLPSELRKRLPKKRTFLIILIFILCLSFASLVAMAQENTVIVDSQTLNIRQGPGMSHDIIDQAEVNDRLQVIDQEDEWLKVSLDGDQVGWVASWLVHQASLTSEAQVPATVTGETVSVRSQASTDGDILGQVEKGDHVSVVHQEGNWSQIVFDDQVAWLSSYYLDFQDQDEDQEGEGQRLVQVNDVDANVRAEPSSQSEKIGTAPAYQTYPYLDSQEGWYKVQYSENRVGYIADFLAEEASSSQEGQASQVGIDNNIPISQATIVLDAGHGGKDPGAVSGDTYEKDLALATAFKLQERLASAGADVILTRSEDEFIPLEGRVDQSIQEYADVFVSLHFDATGTPNSMSGTTTYYHAPSDQGLAESINASLADQASLPNNGVRTADYFVLRNNPRPAVLLELGYMDHDRDLEIIPTSQYQEDVAEAIYQGLLDYFE